MYFVSNGSMDSRARHPLDSYLLVAIRAESCLREKLEQINLLSTIAPEKHNLDTYIRELAEVAGWSGRARECFKQNRKLTKLHGARTDVIESILKLELRLNPHEHEMVQAFLAACFARNYFAHHRYLDQELLRSKESAFVLGGIVLTVLLLLA